MGNRSILSMWHGPGSAGDVSSTRGVRHAQCAERTCAESLKDQTTPPIIHPHNAKATVHTSMLRMHHGVLTSCFPLAYRASAVVPSPLRWSSTLSLSEPTCRVAARTVRPAPRSMSVGCGGATVADTVPGARATKSVATLQGLRLPARWLANTALARNCRIWIWILGCGFIAASWLVPCGSGIFQQPRRAQ